MRPFKDAKGRTWELEINVWLVRRVRDYLGLNLYNLVDSQARPLGELLNDPARLVDVLFLLCRDQADTLNVTDEAFGRSFSGDSLEDAADAFVAALLDFFPSRQGRATLQKVIDKSKAVEARMRELTEEKLESLTVESLAKKLSGLYGRAPDKSEPTPAPGPSES